MRERDAQDIIRMIEANWRMDLAQARSIWRTALVPLDAAIAMQAVERLATKQGRRIDLIDVLQTYEAICPPRTQVPKEPEIKATEPMEWVFIWKWARFARQPPELRSMPQQAEWVAETLTGDEYAELKKEWVAAGAPKDLPTQVLARI